jgi:prolyl-tRNA synthetase
MYISKAFIPILKNNPSEAKIKSHQLMLRVGMIKQSSAGIYSWLPLGLKVMKKIENIVREEQNKIGAQEILMPTIQSSEIWKESGRYDDYGDEMLRIKDRQNREMLYGPTNEELVTDIFRSSIKSYKSLPQLLYHIQWKFRDEIRPRFGIMRCREFYMKDAYSFDINDDDAVYSYNKFFLSYLKTFKRLDLTAIPMAADTGPIGGSLSHEFIILADTGESKIFTDKRIFDLNFEGSTINKKSLENLRNKYEKFYSVTDEKYNKEDFEKEVLEKDRLITKGIEVGHIFYFGDKYSKPLNASVDLSGGKKDFVKMGSYGIGVSRLVGAIIEAKYNEKEEIMKWPLSVTPYECAIIPIINKKDSTLNFNLDKSEKIYDVLNQNNIDTIVDDTDENISSKIKKFNLIGVPFQIILGKNSDGDLLEFQEIGKETQKLNINQIIKLINEQKVKN